MARDKEKKREYDREYRKRNRAKRNASTERFYAANPEKRKAKDRAAHLRKYGLTLAAYEALFTKQAGVCAICQSAPVTGELLCVDHCHDTGAVRGLLCRKCNAGLGMFGDSDPAVLLRAHIYLREA